MSFSERYGYKKINEALLKESMPEQLKTRIWNIFHQYVFRIYHTRDFSNFSDSVTDFIPVLKERRHNDKFWKRISKKFDDYQELEKDLFVYWFQLAKRRV